MEVACHDLTTTGFAVLRDVVASGFGESVIGAIAALPSEVWRKTSEASREYLFGLQISGALELLDNGILDRCLDRLFFGQARLISATVRYLSPGCPDQHLHRDYPTVWPTQREAGTLWVLPPTLIVGYYPQGLTPTRAPLQVVPASQTDSPTSVDINRIQSLTPGARDLVLFDAALVHGSAANTTNGPRLAMFLDFAPAYVRRPHELLVVDRVTDRQKRLLGDWYQR